MLINNKITIARHVDIVENKQNLVGFNGETDSDNESEKSIDERTECNEISQNEINENLIKSKKKEIWAIDLMFLVRIRRFTLESLLAKGKYLKGMDRTL